MPLAVPDALAATQARLSELFRIHDMMGLPHETREEIVLRTLKAFEAHHGICGKFDGNLVILDYDTINVKWSEPYGHVCRGLILDPMNGWAVIAFGLNKFFNHGESNAAPIDWNTARCFEKLDGAMVQRYWNPYTEQFEFSTRFQLHADLAKNKVSSLSDMTWLDMIERSRGRSYGWPEQARNETYVFEVQTPLNRIVVQHKDFKANLIAIRNNDTLVEACPLIRLPGWAPFSVDFIKDAEECKAVADSYSGAEQEGFVVRDANFNRVKIKNTQYVALHRLKDNINSVGAVINLAKNGDFEEVLVNFPEYTRGILMAKEAIAKLLLNHEDAYAKLKGLPTQKEFALAVTAANLRCPSALFLTRAGKAQSPTRAIMDMRENAFIEVVKSVLPKEFVEACLLPPTNVPPEVGSALS